MRTACGAPSAKDGGNYVGAEKGDLAMADDGPVEAGDGSRENGGDKGTADEVPRGLGFHGRLSTWWTRC